MKMYVKCQVYGTHLQLCHLVLLLLPALESMELVPPLPADIPEECTMLEHNGTFLSDLLSSPAALLLLHAQLLDDVPEGGHGGVDHLLRGEEEVLGPQLQYGDMISMTSRVIHCHTDVYCIGVIY